MHEDFYLLGSKVFYLADLDLALFAGLHNGVAYGGHGLTVRYLCDGQRLVVHLVDFSTDLHYTTAFAIVIARYIDGTASLEVRI